MGNDVAICGDEDSLFLYGCIRGLTRIISRQTAALQVSTATAWSTYPFRKVLFKKSLHLPLLLSVYTQQPTTCPSRAACCKINARQFSSRKCCVFFPFYARALPLSPEQLVSLITTNTTFFFEPFSKFLRTRS